MAVPCVSPCRHGVSSAQTLITIISPYTGQTYRNPTLQWFREVLPQLLHKDRYGVLGWEHFIPQNHF